MAKRMTFVEAAAAGRLIRWYRPIIHCESKNKHQTLGHNFTNYYPIFKIFSLAVSVVNLQQTHA